MSEEKEILNLREASEFLGISYFGLRMLAASGNVPASKLGRQWRFSKSDLIAHLRAQYKQKDVAPTPEV